MTRSVRIGGGLGYWGDDRHAAARLVRDGNLDYLVLDFLAEVTMSILQKQRRRDPETGYARDVLAILRETLPLAVERGTKIVCNAGGVNPEACARAVRELTVELGLESQVVVGAVVGDDLFPRVAELRAADVDLANLDTAEPFELVADRLTSANAYIGTETVVEALGRGCTVVVAGRLADPSMTLAPLMHELDWAVDDWDHLAAGIVAGHLIECGAHSTGGNHHDWEEVPDMEDIGFPIVEVDRDGRIVMTKTPGSGGLVSVATVSEQLVYEIGDPSAYLTPDVTADLTGLTVRQLGPDEVEVTGARGRPAPATLKVSATYSDGYSGSTLYLYSAPGARRRAEKAAEVLRRRVERLGLPIDELRVDLIGTGAVHGPRSGVPADADPPEVVLRFAARSSDRRALEEVFAEVTTIFHGPPGKTNLLSGRARVSETLGFWPALVPRDLVSTKLVLT